MVTRVNEDLGLDHRARTRGSRSRGPAHPAAMPPPARDPVGQLPRALEILAVRMREAVAERRASPLGSERYRRADELVAYLNELYVQLQRRMEIPGEVWLLGGRTPVGGRR